MMIYTHQIRTADAAAAEIPDSYISDKKKKEKNRRVTQTEYRASKRQASKTCFFLVLFKDFRNR